MNALDDDLDARARRLAWEALTAEEQARLRHQAAEMPSHLVPGLPAIIAEELLGWQMTVIPMRPPVQTAPFPCLVRFRHDATDREQSFVVPDLGFAKAACLALLDAVALGARRKEPLPPHLRTRLCTRQPDMIAAWHDKFGKSTQLVGDGTTKDFFVAEMQDIQGEHGDLPVCGDVAADATLNVRDAASSRVCGCTDGWSWRPRELNVAID